MKPAGVLDQRSPPRHGKRQEERIQPRVVEALADVASGREDEALLTLRNPGEPLLHGAPLLGAHAASQDDEMSREALQPARQEVQVVLPFREKDR